MKKSVLDNEKPFYLDGIQRRRLADLLEDYVDDYGIAEIARFTGINKSYLEGIINESARINNWVNDIICKRLAINPNYVLFDKNPIYLNNPKPWISR